MSAPSPILATYGFYFDGLVIYTEELRLAWYWRIVRWIMSDLMVSTRERAFTTLRDLQQSADVTGSVSVTNYVQAMQSQGVTADEAVSTLQDLIADAHVILTNHYRLRVA